MDAALFLLRPLSFPEVVCAAVLSLVALLLVQFLARPQPMVAVRDGEDAPSLPSVSSHEVAADRRSTLNRKVSSPQSVTTVHDADVYPEAIGLRDRRSRFRLARFSHYERRRRGSPRLRGNPQVFHFTS